MLLADYPIHDFELWIEDIKQAYFQTRKELYLEVYISDAPREFGKGNSKYLRLEKILYSLSEVDDLRHVTAELRYRRDQAENFLLFFKALYIYKDRQKMIKLCAFIVYELLSSSILDFCQMCSTATVELDIEQKS